jgi:DNA-directed RNA polymerase specialized sigma24 family protein
MAESAGLRLACQGDLVALLRRAQDGSDEAARAVFDRCRQPLLAVIRKVIRRPIRRLYDSDDFLLSTFKEIFTRHFSDEVLCNPDTLWPYLKRIAENKVRDVEHKYLVSESYRIDRDVPLHQLAEDQVPKSREFSPDEMLIFKELVEERLEHLIQQLPVLLQNVVDLLLEGNSGIEIAVLLGIEPKRVYRAINWLKSKIMEP